MQVRLPNYQKNLEFKRRIFLHLIIILRSKLTARAACESSSIENCITQFFLK